MTFCLSKFETCLGTWHLSEQGENEEFRTGSLKILAASVLRAQHGRGKRGVCSPAQWTSEQTLFQVFETQPTMQHGVQPWCPAVVWWEGLHTLHDCWPEVVWVISFQVLGPRSYRHIPGAYKALPDSRAAQSVVSGDASPPGAQY